MKLVEFRIENFRSISDTGWRRLSADGVTCLIGQNESGKTSILEALEAFYTGEIHQDYLRDDQQMPKVSCRFEIDWKPIVSNLDDYRWPPGFATWKNEDGSKVSLVRSWTEQGASILELADEGLVSMIREFKSFVESSRLESSDETNEPDTGDATVAPGGKSVGVEDFRQVITTEGLAEHLEGWMPIFVRFTDYESLLPDRIDLADLKEGKRDAEGYEGVRNFLSVSGMDIGELEGERRIIENRINQINNLVTTDFQAFWSQGLGRNTGLRLEVNLEHHSDAEDKPGEAYLAFWMSHGDRKLYPKQRSGGVRWFLSFYLQLKASAPQSGEKGMVFLIDEPGGSLHAKAQDDVLRLFDSVKERTQIVYTTHSPFLVRQEDLYRILAVQRSVDGDMWGDTDVLDVHNLGHASFETLTPLYMIMGMKLSQQSVIREENNIIVEEPSAHYYLLAFRLLCGSGRELHFVAAEGASNVPKLAYLFEGWGLQFGVVMDDDSAGRSAYRKIKKNLYGDDQQEADLHMYRISPSKGKGIENVFSNADFKKYVAKTRKPVMAGEHATFLTKSGRSKPVVAREFYVSVKNGDIQLADLNKTSQKNIRALVERVESLA